jgi:hypothetical protein
LMKGAALSGRVGRVVVACMAGGREWRGEGGRRRMAVAMSLVAERCEVGSCWRQEGIRLSARTRIIVERSTPKT